MTSFTFRGPQAGSAVAISAVQGANNASETVQTWGQGNVGNVDIQMVQGELIAPSMIWFEAINISGFNVPAGAAPGEVYEPGFHEITYFWDFGEAGDTQFSAPLNIPDIWNDRSIAYGSRACHVFRTPGTYTVSLWCVDSDGTVGQATVNVTISDPDSIFTGSRTICFANDGDFTGAPTGAQQITSIAALVTAIDALSQPGRVLFRRGSVQEVSLDLNRTAVNQNLRFGAFGNGARPIIQPPFAGTVFSIGQNALAKDITYESLDIRGRWDPAFEVGSAQDTAFSVLGRDISEMTTLLHDCRLSGLSIIDISTLRAVPFTSVVSDSVIEDWCLYGFFSNRQNDGVNDNSRIAIVGSAIQQHPHACKGADTGGFDGIQNQNGPVRYASARKFLMRSCYLFSNNSWALGSQPALRMMTGNSGGCSAIVDRVAFEGGSVILSVDGSPDSPGNFLFDKVLLAGTADTVSFARVGNGGTTLRNVLMWQPNVPFLGYGFGTSELISNAQDDNNPANLAAPVALYNISALDDLAGNPRIFSELSEDFTNYTEENNLLHAPNWTTPLTSDTPLDLSDTLAGFSPRYAGRRNSISRPQNTTTSGTPVGASIVFSYPAGQDAVTILSASDFSQSGRHFVKNLTTGDYYYLSRGDFSISFGTSITLINTSGASMVAGDYRLALEYAGLTTETQHASPAAVPLPRPLSGSAAYRSAAGDYITLHDFQNQTRPGFPIQGSGAVTASRGATEPL